MDVLRKVLFVSSFCFLVSCQSTQPHTDSSSTSGVHPYPLASREQVSARGKKWVVSTEGKLSTDAAAKVLKEGGNLVDAAIAGSFAISVERPHSTGLGGGGFMIYYEAKTKVAHVVDFRERAPKKAMKDMYLDKKGNVIPDLSVDGGLSVGVPGLVRGLSYVHKKWGKAKWSKIIQPSIDMAENGFAIYPSLDGAIGIERETLDKFTASRKIFLNSNGSKKKLGEILVQKDLAKSLRSVAENSENFYRGKIAARIAATVKKYRGILTEADLAAYKVKERAPVRASYKDFEVISMSPPSSGGIHVIQILKLLEQDPLAAKDYLNPETIHMIAQADQQAFADRAKYLGDPEFVKVPVKQLIDAQYLSELRKKFNLDHARKANEVTPGAIEMGKEPDHTTHLSLMDEEGNVVVTTQSINKYFGSKVVAEGTGIVLNNTMDDFSAKPGTQNSFGAVGSDANSVQAGKTPLSSMSPTIVLRNGQPILALGAAGGTRILTSVAHIILGYLVFNQDLYTALSMPRFHHQWMPDQLVVEQGLPVAIDTHALEKKGYVLKKVVPSANRVQAVARDDQGLIGVADPRDIGTSAAQ